MFFPPKLPEGAIVRIIDAFFAKKIIYNCPRHLTGATIWLSSELRQLNVNFPFGKEGHVGLM